MSKTYILKKDFPCIKYSGAVVTMAAGTKVQKKGSNYAVPTSEQFLHAEVVENNPEWFEEVKEAKNEFKAGVVNGTNNAQLLFSGPLLEDEKLILRNVVAKFVKRINKRRNQPNALNIDLIRAAQHYRRWEAKP
jgi:hypothetical protein